MFRNRGDDRNMNFSIAGVPKGVKPSSPWRDNSRNGKKDKGTDGDEKDEQDEAPKKCLELLARELQAYELHKGNKLQQTKDTYDKSVVRLQRKTHGKAIVPKADMCSLLFIGRNPTKGICMLANVPNANHVL